MNLVLEGVVGRREQSNDLSWLVQFDLEWLTHEERRVCFLLRSFVEQPVDSEAHHFVLGC